MSLPPVWLCTQRLSLRRFAASDLPFLCGLYGDERIARHVGGVKTPDECHEMLQERILGYYAAHPGLGIWLTCERDRGRPVGLHLLNHVRGEPDIQVGYVLDMHCWGRGYATEMACALLWYGFRVRGLERIVAITGLANVASQHVLQKSGLQRRGERLLAHPAYAGKPLAWFECSAAGWAPRLSGAPAAMRAEDA